jgi:hypothetical protein
MKVDYTFCIYVAEIGKKNGIFLKKIKKYKNDYFLF